MRSFAALLALAAAVPFVLGDSNGMQVNSLTGVVTCEPVKFTYSGGQPPYYLTLIPAGQPSGAPLKQFPPTQDTQRTWTVDLPAGTAFTTELKDSTGAIVYSGEQTVQKGSDESCVNNSVMEGGGSSSTSSGAMQPSTPATTGSMVTSTTAPGTSMTSMTTSGQASTTGTGSTTSTRTQVTAAAASSSGSSATATSTQNAAGRGTSANAVGIAGLLGLVGAALF